MESTLNKNIDSVVIEAEKSERKSMDNNQNTDLKVSKRELKRIKKHEKWLERKPAKRLKEKAKAKEKRANARANNIEIGPSRKYLKTVTMADSSCKISVTIDLSFDELMIPKDIAKLIKQILRCYTLNRRAIAPLQFSLSNFEGRSLAEMGKHNGYENWDVKFYSQNYINVFPKEKIVYLTSESENVIEELNCDFVYVIGGLVDHNCHKGLCHKMAVENGVSHGRLPLDKFLQMKARKVLTVDHVFEIILKKTEGKSWQEAFLEVLPERKNAQPVLDKSFQLENPHRAEADDSVQTNTNSSESHEQVKNMTEQNSDIKVS